MTAVTRPGNLDLLRSIGADHVVDHAREDFTQRGRYDLIVDVGGNRSIADCRRALKAGGTLVLVGAGMGFGGPVARMTAGAVRSGVLRQSVSAFISKESTDDLLTLKDMLESGKVTPLIDRTYPLSETTEAIGYLESGRARGKVVIRM